MTGVAFSNEQRQILELVRTLARERVAPLFTGAFLSRMMPTRSTKSA